VPWPRFALAGAGPGASSPSCVGELPGDGIEPTVCVAFARDSAFEMDDPDAFESGLSDDEMDRVLDDIDFSDVLTRGEEPRDGADGAAGVSAGEVAGEVPIDIESDDEAAGTTAPSGADAADAADAPVARAPIVCEARGVPAGTGGEISALTVRGRRHVAIVAETPLEAGRMIEFMAGLSEIGERELRVFGHDLHGLGPEALAATRAMLIGGVVERVPLIASLTVEDNLRVALLGAQVEARTAGVRVAELIERLELEGVRERHPEELDREASWRVRIARALAHRPPLCVVDVTTPSLDPGARTRVLDTIGALVEGTATTVVLACPADAVPAWVHVRVSPAPREEADTGGADADLELELEDA
jgi:putative ABC transport system ATP-binding protein